MKCRTPDCRNMAKYEGYCPYCVNQLWVECQEPGCDQLTMDKSGRCYLHREAQKYVPIAEAARMLGVSTKTVQRYTDRGWLTCTYTPSRHRRFKVDDIRRCKEEYSG